MAEATTATVSSRKQWERLIENLPRHLEVEEVEVFCHCTSKEKKGKILSDGKLKGFETSAPENAPLAKAGKKVKGVWFIATKYLGELPTISWYGPKRVHYPLKNFINSENKREWKLFFEATYFFNYNTQYVRLILAKEPTEQTKKDALEWCNENLHEIDLCNNPILCYNQDMTVGKTVEGINVYGTVRGGMSVIKNSDKGVGIWVEVLLLGNVEILKWDTVTVDPRPGGGTDEPILDISPYFKK